MDAVPGAVVPPLVEVASDGALGREVLGQEPPLATASLLEDLCGWSISDERLHQACHEEARRIADWRANQPQAVEPFPTAKGLVEFQTDATKVNTDTGWRDLKIAIFAKRPPGSAATPE